MGSDVYTVYLRTHTLKLSIELGPKTFKVSAGISVWRRPFKDEYEFDCLRVMLDNGKCLCCVTISPR